MKTKNCLPFISILTLFTLITVLPLYPAAAAETADYEVVPCDVECYVISDDPAGVKVRSGPGEEYPVVGTLSTDPGAFVAPTITGCAGEWLRIEDIWVGTMGEGSIHPDYSDSNPLGLTGWICEPVLGVKTQGPEGADADPPSAVVRLYEEPATSSAVLARVRSYIDVPIIGCRGEWLKVRYRGVDGWLAPQTYCAEPGPERCPY